jgi:hypothetical protein
MLRLLEWLRHLDASLLSPAERTEAVASVTVWAAVLAVAGGLVVMAASLVLASHAVLQLAGITAGMVMTVPYLQDVFDKARASAQE